MGRPAVRSFDDALTKRRPRARAVLAIVAGLMLSPFIAEGAAVNVARWRGMFGVVPAVETPVSDALASVLTAASRDAWLFGSGLIRAAPLDPYWVIVVGIVWAVIGGHLLMRRF